MIKIDINNHKLRDYDNCILLCYNDKIKNLILIDNNHKINELLENDIGAIPFRNHFFPNKFIIKKVKIKL